MTTEEIIKGLESVKTECGKHLNEGFAWICKPIDEAIEKLKREPSMDAVSREAVLDEFDKWVNSREKYYEHPVEFARSLMSLPPVTPERTTITYKDCSEAMLKMWIDNVLTDGQYNKIMDKLNAKHIADMKGVSKCSEEKQV